MYVCWTCLLHERVWSTCMLKSMLIYMQEGKSWAFHMATIKRQRLVHFKLLNQCFLGKLMMSR